MSKELRHFEFWKGTFHGNMKYTNAWGDKCIIRPDFSGLDFENKKKGGKA